ncbi:hypothetical protein H5T58_01875, partial [Candidatus Parcubacteria bacterium]|nr:hypothetical protein [Candidatus Parcubacteria bacterium]
KQGSEECDGHDFGGTSCKSFGYSEGELICRPNCTIDTSKCVVGAPGGGGGGGISLPLPTKVVFEGKTSPFATIFFLMDGKGIGQTTADKNGNFHFEIEKINQGVFTFSFWAQDKKERRTITISLSTSVLEGQTNKISPIFLPPTIALNKINFSKGETIEVEGESIPFSKIYLHFGSEKGEILKITESQENGEWQYQLNSEFLAEGVFNLKARAETKEGTKTSFSNLLTFAIGKYKITEKCPRGDFNKDGRTNLIDFSILLYWWGKPNGCVDQNEDGIVNLPDFSILLYYWTG